MPVVFLYKVPRWLALGIVLLLGAGMFAVPQALDLFREAGWQQTNGQVESVHQVTRPCGRNECPGLEVEYRYTVAASAYTGQAEVNGRATDYVVGSSIPVRYDSRNPTSSTLDSAPASQRALGFGSAAVIAGLGVLCLVKAAGR